MPDKQKHKNYFSNDGHLTDLSIAHVVDALLYNKENTLPQEIKEHISHCQECKLNIIESYEVMSKERLNGFHPFFSTKESDISKKGLSKLRLTKDITRIAATILIIISIGTIGILLKKQSTKKISDVLTDSVVIDTFDSIKQQNKLIVDNVEQEQEEEVYKDSIIKKEPIEDKNLIAQADLSGEEYRLSVTQVAMLSNIMRSDYFELTSPKDSTIFNSTDTINFSWNSDIEEELYISVYNNKETLIFKSEPFINQFFRLDIKLDNGVYLWHLESKDDIIYTGVFFMTE